MTLPDYLSQIQPFVDQAYQEGFTPLEATKLFWWWTGCPRENAFVSAQFLEFGSC